MPDLIIPAQYTRTDAPTDIAPEGEYYGGRPGFDWQDLYSVPWRTVLEPTLDYLGRPADAARTLLSTGDLGEAGRAFTHERTPVSSTELRQQYLAGDEAFGDVPYLSAAGRFGADLVTGMVTDPTTYLTLGTTAAGKATQNLAGDALRDLSQVGKAGQAEVRAAYLARGLNIPEQIPAGWRGTAPTLAGRLKSGESGLQVGLPFGLSGQTTLEGVNRAAGGALDAVSSVTRPITGIVENTALGRAAKQGMRTISDTFTTPSVRDAQGMLSREADNIARNAGEELSVEFLQPLLPEINKIRPDARSAIRPLLEAMDPDNELAAVLRPHSVLRGTDEAKAAGVMDLRATAEEALVKIPGLTPEERASLFAVAEKLHFANIAARKKASDLGVKIPQLGDAIKNGIKETQKEIDTLTAKIAERTAKGKNSDGLTKELEGLNAKLADFNAKKAEIPNYFPGQIDPDTLHDYYAGSGKKITPSDRTVMGERSFVHEYGPLKGVPLSVAEAEKRILEQGGTRATNYVDPRGTVPFSKAVKAMFTKDGLKEIEAEAAKTSKFFTSDPMEAYSNYFGRSFTKIVRNQTFQNEILNTFNAIPESAWQSAKSAVKAGDSFEDAAAAFKKATNVNLEDVLPRDMVDRLGAAKALETVSGPNGWHAYDNFGGAGKAFLPGDVADRYNRWLDASGKRAPEFFKLVAPVLRTWKAGQTWIWPDYHLRNQLSDWFRMFQEGTMDAGTWNDYGAMKKAILSVGKEGYGDFKNFTELVDVGAGAQFFKGQRQVPLADVMKQAQRQGLLGSNQTLNLIEDAAEREISQLKFGPDVTQKIKRVMAYREDSNKVASFLARLRAGDSPLEAGLRAEEATFNFTRQSTAANWLRWTGVAPFIGFQAKNLPAQIHHAIEHPGEFMAMVRGLQMLQNNEIPEDVLPTHMKNTYGLVLKKSKNPETGKPEWVYVQNKGIIPMIDLVDFARNPLDAFKAQMNPLIQLAGKAAWGRERDEEGWGKEVTQALVGKAGVGGAAVGAVGYLAGGLGPLGAFAGGMFQKLLSANVVDPRTGTVKRDYVDALSAPFNPLSLQELDILNLVDKADSHVKTEYRKAVGELRRLTINLNMANEFSVGDKTDLIRQKQKTEANLQQKLAAMQTELERNAKVRQNAMQVNLAK